jgi:hypothetical protein
MNEALETLYALRIICWCRHDKSGLRQINRDIDALLNDMKGLA